MSGEAIEAARASTLQNPKEVAANMIGKMLVCAINRVQKPADIPNLAIIIRAMNI